MRSRLPLLSLKCVSCSLTPFLQTITQTRLHYQRVVAGFDNDIEGEDIKWKEDFTRHPRSAEEESRSSRKGKERASLGNESGDRRQREAKAKDKASPALNAEETSEQAAAKDG